MEREGPKGTKSVHGPRRSAQLLGRSERHQYTEGKVQNEDGDQRQGSQRCSNRGQEVWPFGKRASEFGDVMASGMRPDKVRIKVRIEERIDWIVRVARSVFREFLARRPCCNVLAVCPPPIVLHATHRPRTLHASELGG